MLENGKNTHKKKGIPPQHGGFAFKRLVIAFAALAAVLCALLTVQGAGGLSGPALARPSSGGAPSETDTTVKDVVTLDMEINDLNQRISELKTRSAELEVDIEKTESEIETSRERLDSKREALNRRARSLYMNGRSSRLEALFATDDISEFLRLNDYLEILSEEDARLVSSVKEQSRKLDESLADLKSEKEEVDSVASDLESRKSRLEDTKSRREELLSESGESREAVEASSSEVEEKFEQINPPEPEVKHTGRFLTMQATAYSPEEPGLSDHTATGMRAQYGVVAVDPSVIPLGTRLHVEGYGTAIAADTGGAIKGMRIDLCFNTLEEVQAYGWRTVRVEILD